MKSTMHNHFGAHGAIAAVAVFGLGGMLPRCVPIAQSNGASTPTASECTTLTNRERASAGLSALAESSALVTAANEHSNFQAKSNTMTHTGSGGSTLGQRLSNAGYQYVIGAENVAVGYANCTDVVKGWMNSPGHRANILNAKINEIGVSAATASNGSIYWTMDLGSRAG
jgi:uncharacterized protein YkwD